MQTETCRGRIPCNSWGILQRCLCSPRNTRDCWQPPETRKRQGRILPLSLWRERGPADTLVSDVSPLELRINFCYFKPSSLWKFLISSLWELVLMSLQNPQSPAGLSVLRRNRAAWHDCPQRTCSGSRHCSLLSSAPLCTQLLCRVQVFVTT